MLVSGPFGRVAVGNSCNTHYSLWTSALRLWPLLENEQISNENCFHHRLRSSNNGKMSRPFLGKSMHYRNSHFSQVSKYVPLEAEEKITYHTCCHCFLLPTLIMEINIYKLYTKNVLLSSLLPHKKMCQWEWLCKENIILNYTFIKFHAVNKMTFTFQGFQVINY